MMLILDSMETIPTNFLLTDDDAVQATTKAWEARNRAAIKAEEYCIQAEKEFLVKQIADKVRCDSHAKASKVTETATKAQEANKEAKEEHVCIEGKAEEVHKKAEAEEAVKEEREKVQQCHEST